MDRCRDRLLREATVRACTAAAALFGTKAAGRRFMTTENFALGGATPLQMLGRPGGEAAVMTELQTQADSGPL